MSVYNMSCDWLASYSGCIPFAQCSWHCSQIHCDPDLNKPVTDDEYAICFFLQTFMQY